MMRSRQSYMQSSSDALFLDGEKEIDMSALQSGLVPACLEGLRLYDCYLVLLYSE